MPVLRFYVQSPLRKLRHDLFARGLGPDTISVMTLETAFALDVFQQARALPVYSEEGLAGNGTRSIGKVVRIRITMLGYDQYHREC